MEIVYCSNCQTPASKSLSEAVGWIGCAPCITGEADSFDDDDLIVIESETINAVNTKENTQ